VPKIMDVVKQRLTDTYMTLNETTPGSPVLRRIRAHVTRCNEMMRAATHYG
jgi:hypothetical protein